MACDMAFVMSVARAGWESAGAVVFAVTACFLVLEARGLPMAGVVLQGGSHAGAV